MIIGVVSDTHGFVDHRLVEALAGVDAILHAGDVGGLDVLERLRRIAPLYAVRGNNDERLGGLGLPAERQVELDGLAFQLVHERGRKAPGPETAVVVFGHSHKALVESADGRLYVNPGAAGRVGFHRLQTAAIIETNAGEPQARIVELGPREKR